MHIDGGEPVLTKQSLPSGRAAEPSAASLEKPPVALAQQDQQKGNASYSTKESKDKPSSVPVAPIQSGIQSLGTANPNKGTLTSKASPSKLPLKDQATAPPSGPLANLVEIADEVEIVEDPFKQAIDGSGATSAARPSAPTFKYKLPACGQFFGVPVLLNDYSKSARGTVEEEEMGEGGTEGEVEGKENKHQRVEK